MTSFKFNTTELLELSLFPHKKDAAVAIAESQTTAARTAAKIQQATLEGLVPDEETAQLRRENARLKVLIENAKLAAEAKKLGVTLGDKEET